MIFFTPPLPQDDVCPSCGTPEEEYDGPDFYICSHCETLHGRGSLEESYQYCVPLLSTEEESLSRSVPFDMLCSDPKRGLIHRIGMYDPETTMITQAGPYKLGPRWS